LSHIANYVSLSRALPHPFSGITRQFELSIRFLVHPIHCYHIADTYLLIDQNPQEITVGYFVPNDLFFYFRVNLSTGDIDDATLDYKDK
jgi:hypothetical protein